MIGARELRILFDEYGIRPRKELGQNFVIDPNTIRKIVREAGIGPEDDVLEIGAGGGSLTFGLAAQANSVTAVEVDERMAPVLRKILRPFDNVQIVFADALRMDMGSIRANKLVGNLPYNIAGSVVLKVLEEAPNISELTVMTQKEVGERLAAPPGGKAYGIASVLVAYFASAKVAARISRKAFFPVPRVDSVIVRLERRTPPVEEHERLFAVVRGAFSQRRKTLRNSLAEIAGSPGAAAEACTRAGIDPGARAETVDLAGFISLAAELA